LVACVKSKRFINFCEKFEGFWFEFDLKRNYIEKRLGKKKKKEREQPYLSAQRPAFPSPAAAHAPPRHPFLFSFLSLTRRPRLSVLLLPLPFFLPSSASTGPSAPAISTAPGRLPSSPCPLGSAN
jgi:hypothetical protein